MSPDQFSLGPSVFGIENTSTTSFDLLEFWVACFDTAVHYATACNLTVVGTEVNAADPVEMIEPLLFSYEPASNSLAALMSKVTTNLYGLSSVVIGFYQTSDEVQLGTHLGTDFFQAYHALGMIETEPRRLRQKEPSNDPLASRRLTKFSIWPRIDTQGPRD